MLFAGTYNNQYMVIDLKKIHLKSAIDDGALWVVEQIPSLVEAGDMTPILRTGKYANEYFAFTLQCKWSNLGCTIWSSTFLWNSKDLTKINMCF